MFHFEKLNKRLNDKDIHYLRRAGKKLKFFCSFVELLTSDDKTPKLFKPVKGIYESAGNYRELHVNTITLDSYNPSAELSACYELFLKSEINRFEKELRSEIRSFKASKEKKTINRMRQICQSVPKDKLIQTAQSFIADRLHTFDTSGLDLTENETIHHLRLQLKRANLVCSILCALKFDGFDVELISSIKTIEDRLGYWHDRDVLAISLGTMLESNNIKETVYSEAQDLQKQLAIEDLAFKDELPSLLAPIVFKLSSALKLL